MKRKITSPKGMKDFFSQELQKKQKVLEKAREISLHYGFEEIETPILEFKQVFLKGIGKENEMIEKEMYSFFTKGNDELALRPEGTASVMRAYLEHGMHSLPQPRLFFYHGPFFRHERPQRGRYRQFSQFGLEIIGSKNAFYDAFIISTGYEILSSLGIQVTLSINTIGTKKEQEKYKKVLSQFYNSHRSELSPKDRKKIEKNPLRILDSKEKETQQINEKAPDIYQFLGKESRDFFERILSLLKKRGIPFVRKKKLVRGLDYYEHDVFEYEYEYDDGNILSLGGGGRYDELSITLGYQNPIPSVGLAIGIERISEILSEESKRKKIFFIIRGKQAEEIALQKLPQWKNSNYSFFPETKEQSLRKQIEKALKYGYHFVFILDEEEVKNKTIQIKNLSTRKQETVPIEEIEKKIKAGL